MAHRLRRITAFAAALASTPARADPVSIGAIITSAVTAAQAFGATTLFTIGTYSLTVGAIVGPLVTTAIGLGLTLLFAPRASVPKPEDGVVAVQQALPYRIFAFGRCRIAGAIMLKEQVAGYLVYVAALAGHQADGFEAFYLNDDEVSVVPIVAGAFVVGVKYTIVTVGTTNFTSIGASASTIGVQFIATGVGLGTGTATPTDLITGNIASGADGRYKQAIVVDTRLGLATETYYDFISALVPTEWTVNHRGDGQASVAMECLPVPSQNFSTTFPYASPQPSVVGRWCLTFDPRDVTQDPNNPATFKWTQNAALVIMWWRCFSQFGFRCDYSVAILPVLSFWITAINACDDAMPLKAGGTELRYRIGGWATTQMARSTTELAMLQCCDGFLSRRGRSYVLQVGKYIAPTDPPITDADIAGFTIQSDVATEDKVNEAVAHYTSVDNGYVTVDTDPLEDDVDQAARGGAPRKAQLDLTWVQSTGQASRLLKREFYRQSVPVRGTLTLYWSGLNAAFERWIPISSNTIPRLSGVVVENRKAVISPKTRTLTIDYILSGPDIDDYDPSVDESAPPSIPQRPAAVSLPIPTTVSVVGELVTDNTGASTVVLNVSWDEPFFNGIQWPLNYIVQYRFTNVGGSPGTWSAPQTFLSPLAVALRISVTTGVVPSGTSLDVEVASVGTGASLSTFSAIHTVSTALADLAPQPPAWVFATGASGSASLRVAAPNSANFYGIQFYRALSGGPFSSATAIGSVVTGAPLSTINHTDTVAAGTYDYFAVSETSASVSSNDAGPETAVVT